MKKEIIRTIGILSVTVIFVGVSGIFSLDGLAATSRKGVSASASISETEARNIVLKDAALSSDDVTFTKITKKVDHNLYIYDLEFYTDDYTRYEYEIAADGSSIISFDIDENLRNYNSPKTSDIKITLDEARAIALKHAGTEAGAVTFVKAERDIDDGQYVYEIEFYLGADKEYDYKITADDGRIISYDQDAEYSSNGPVGVGGVDATSDGHISYERAMELALERVPGATEQNVREFEADNDGGRLRYEGSIYYQGYEYDFEIDGYSGVFIEWDVERD